MQSRWQTIVFAWIASLVIHLLATLFLLRIPLDKPASLDARYQPRSEEPLPVELVRSTLNEEPPEKKEEAAPEEKTPEPKQVDVKPQGKKEPRRQKPIPKRRTVEEPVEEPTKQVESAEPVKPSMDVPVVDMKDVIDTTSEGLSSQTGTTRASPAEKDTAQPKRVETGKSGFKKSYREGELAPTSVVTNAPEVLQEVKPNYPERMRDLGIEGKVVLEILIDGKGRVTQAKPIQKLHPTLDAEAIRAAKQMKFKAAQVDGVAVQVKWRYTFVFVLD